MTADQGDSPKQIWKRIKADLAKANRAEKKFARLMNPKTLPGSKFLEASKHAGDAQEFYRLAAADLGILSAYFEDIYID